MKRYQTHYKKNFFHTSAVKINYTAHSFRKKLSSRVIFFIVLCLINAEIVFNEDNEEKAHTNPILSG